MELKNYQEGDELQILELFKKCFGAEMSVEYWHWRFAQNPFRDEKMIQLLWDGDKLVGHYAVSPLELLVDGALSQSALSMTTMTHPQYGGQGIFTKLASSLYNTMHDTMNVDSVIGFPNRNSHFAFIKNLNWRDVGLMQNVSFDKESFKMNGEKSIMITACSDTDFAFTQNHAERFLEHCPAKNSIHKTADYYNWRYISNPSFNYSVAEHENGDFIVFKQYNNDQIDILEMNMANDVAVITSFFSALFAQAVISNGFPTQRQTIYSKFSSYKFPNIINPEVELHASTKIGCGNIIKQGTILTVDITIGNNNYINRGVQIGHDCILKSHNVINPGAILSGQVFVGNTCLIGTHATVLQNQRIESSAQIGAGAVVTKNVKEGTTVVGVPAKDRI